MGYLPEAKSNIGKIYALIPGEVESRVNQLNKFLGRMHTFLPEDLVKLRPRKIRIKALPGTIRVKKGKSKGK